MPVSQNAEIPPLNWSDLGEGDSFVAAFARACIGVHTGEVQLRDDAN
jgi:hypothetical protein